MLYSISMLIRAGMMTNLVQPSHFGDRDFAEANRQYFDPYVEYRVRGYHPHVAFRRVFGEDYMDSNAPQRIEMAEHNPYFRERFATRLKEIKIEELWNEKTSIHELLSLARNPFAKDTTRLNAAKELNILIGITVTDENGKTKKGRDLSDFYDNLPK
jgi:hypothetical protein